MFNLGHTRSDRQPTHLLQTPDTFVGMPLPGFRFCNHDRARGPGHRSRFHAVHRGVRAWRFAGTGARTALSLCARRRPIRGSLSGQTHQLNPGGYAHLPAGQQHTVKASAKSRVAVIEKPAITLPNSSPAAAYFGQEDDVAAQPLGGDSALQVKQLLPTVPGLDYAVNTMRYRARRRAVPGRDPCDGAWAADARGRRHLPAG